MITINLSTKLINYYYFEIFPITDYRLPITDYRLPIINYQFFILHSSFFILNSLNYYEKTIIFNCHRINLLPAIRESLIKFCCHHTRFPIPDSRFPIPDSRFPRPTSPTPL
ncbi:hypothetical protein [Moorena sp. SIO1F2]|uniref:hypothetical protein n=1 Tax=Moorena sp. SIO1F2 TaxID=2607819 RepID=UPI0025D5EBB0|nr:hypothetical protein [Moorena sp. SIO1F2]